MGGAGGWASGAGALWVLAAAAAALALLSALADRRRTRRRDLDRPGWVPWALIQILAMLVAAVAAAFALKG
jgi:hypothetical protein